jgi:D-amino-acid dehydrogenase
MNDRSPHVTVVGGGLIGLSSALFMHQAGATVRVIDQGDLGGGASRGNAGLVCTAILGPLAGPGAIVNAIKSLPSPESALRLHPLEAVKDIGWFVSFARACSAKRYSTAQRALARLDMSAGRNVERLAAAGARIGQGPTLVAPFHDVHLAEHFMKGLEPMREFGFAMPDRLLSGDEVRAMVPALTDHVNAGIHLPGEYAVDPSDFVDSLIEVLTGLGVELLPNQKVESFEHQLGHVSAVVTDCGRHSTDQVVLAAGFGIRRVGKLLGLRIPVIPGQGYNVVLPPSDALPHPVISEEVHAVATPMGGRIRLGGTMEFGGDAPAFDQRRIDAIVRSYRRFLDLDWDHLSSPWAGSRPMSPDGMPLIGRPKGWDNVVLAGGHGMYGLTLAPSTAEVVSQLVVDGRCDADISAFDPNRFRL